MSRVDQEDEDLKMALGQSMQQHESPEPKRSKPWENSASGVDEPEEPPEVKSRRTQRELMAAAAEKRMASVRSSAATITKNMESGKDVKIVDRWMEEVKSPVATAVKNVDFRGLEGDIKGEGVNFEQVGGISGISDTSLSVLEADELFLMIFGDRASKEVLAQWSNQGIR